MAKNWFVWGVAAIALAACGDNIKPIDEGTGLLTIAPSTGLETAEDGTTATFTVALIAEPRDSIEVSLASTNPTEGTLAPSTITFTGDNWDRPQTVTVTGVDDVFDDDDQLYLVTVDAGTWGQGEVALANRDDDDAGVAVMQTAADLQVSETGTTATFSIVLTSRPMADVTIPLSSSDDGEATVSPTSITISPATWDAARTITVTGVNDDVADGDQSAIIGVGAATSSDGGYSGFNANDVSVTNVDDDTANFIVSPTSNLSVTEGAGTGNTAELTVRLATQPTGDVTISVSSTDTSEGTVSDATLTFTPVNWEAPQTVTITGVDDALADGDVDYMITLDNVVSTDANYTSRDPADVAVTTLDNDSANILLSRTSGLITTEGGDSDTFTIVLLSQPTADVVIAFQSEDTTEATVSPASPITFTPADWDTAKTISAIGVDDIATDGHQPFTITLSATSADPNYDGFAIPAVSGTNQDNDIAGIRVTPLRLDVAEFNNDPGDVFEVVLTRMPIGAVTIDLSVSDASEGTIDKNQLTFSTLNWNVPQVVTVKGVDDALIDGQQPFTVVTAPAVSTDLTYNGLDAEDVTVFNFDDESPGVYIQARGLLKTIEGQNQPAFIRMRLTIAPTAPVTCTVSSSDTSEVTVEPSMFVFDASNFDVSQTLTVRGVDDAIADGDQEVIIITHPCTSADPVYNLFDPRNIRVLNRDDEP